MTNFREILADISELLADRIIILDTLSAGQLADEIPAVIQTKPCASSGTQEHFEVRSCDKMAEGFYCRISVTKYTDPQKFSIYTKVNFDGIEIQGSTKNQIFAKDTNLAWKLLTCRQNENSEPTDVLQDLYYVCQVSDYNNECSKNLEAQKIDNLVKYCNFTRNIPIPVTRTKNGILLMGKTATVRLLNTDQTVFKTVDKPLPILISTNKIIELTMNGTVTKIHPTQLVSKEEINDIWLTDEDISKIENSLKIDELVEGMELEDWVDLVLIFLVTVILPALAVLCKKYIQTSDYWINKNLREVKIELPEKRSKRNLKENHTVFAMSRL